MGETRIPKSVRDSIMYFLDGAQAAKPVNRGPIGFWRLANYEDKSMRANADTILDWMNCATDFSDTDDNIQNEETACCANCKHTIPIEFFNKHSERGRQSWCKSCQANEGARRSLKNVIERLKADIDKLKAGAKVATHNTLSGPVTSDPVSLVVRGGEAPMSVGLYDADTNKPIKCRGIDINIGLNGIVVTAELADVAIELTKGRG